MSKMDEASITEEVKVNTIQPTDITRLRGVVSSSTEFGFRDERDHEKL